MKVTNETELSPSAEHSELTTNDGLPDFFRFEFGPKGIRAADYPGGHDPLMLTTVFFSLPVDPNESRAKVLSLLEGLGIKGDTPLWEFCG